MSNVKAGDRVDNTLMAAAWLTWIAVILLFIGIDAIRQKERMGYEKLFNIDKNPLLSVAEKLGPIVAAWFPVANIEGIEQLIIYAAALRP